MKVLIVHNTLNDSTSVSGVMQLFADLANYWIPQGHTVDFAIARAGYPQFQKLVPHAGFVITDGIFNANNYLSSTWKYFPAFAYRMLTCFWAPMPRRYDIVYASGQFIVEVFSACILARRSKAKFFVKIHHILQHQTKRKSLLDRLFVHAERSSVRLINKYAQGIVCIHEQVADEYSQLEKNLHLPARRVHVVHNGVQIAKYQPLPDIPKIYDVVSLGRLHYQKGIFDLPPVWEKVLQKVGDAKLLIIGEGPHKSRLIREFKNRGILQSVTFTGGIDERTKLQFLNQCKIGLSLSFEEGWGLSITEFLAMGLPVVAYDLPVFHHVFNNVLQLVPDFDKSLAACKILHLLKDPAERTRWGQKGRQLVARYDISAVAEKESRLWHL